MIKSIIILSEVSVLVPFGMVLFCRFTGGSDRYILKFIFYVLIAGMVQIASSAMAYAGVSNLTLINVFYPIEFYLIGTLLIDLAKFERALKYIRATFFIALLTMMMSNLAAISNDTFSTPGLLVEGISLLLLAVRVFYKRVRYAIGNPFTDFAFWFASAVMLYFGLSLTAFVFFEGTANVLPLMLYITANIFFNLLTGGAYKCYLQKQQIIASLRY